MNISLKRLQPAVLATGLALLAASPVFAARMDSAVRREKTKGGKTAISLVIRFNSALTSADTALLKKNGITLGVALEDGRTYAASSRKDVLPFLEGWAKVENVSLDAPTKPNIYTSERALVEPSTPWNTDLATTVGLSGEGQTVAVLDSGVSNSPGLASKVAVYYDAITRTQKTAASQFVDGYGHGTHVAGIIAGRLSLQGATYGAIAPNAKLAIVRVLDNTGAGSTANVIHGIDWCIANKARYNISVMNLSLSHPPYESYTTDPLCRAVARAWKAGITVVCSAGNWGREGYGTIGSPGNSPYVITVGAANTNNTFSRTDDTITTYSSRGPTLVDHIVKPDVCAPGNKIWSWAFSNSALYNNPAFLKFKDTVTPNAYAFLELSGTSMAAPVVAGVAALMEQQSGGTATPDQIKSRLMVTATRGSSIFECGSGYVNVTQALASRSKATTSLSPTVKTKANGTYSLVDTITGNTLLWGDSVLWGNTLLWGDVAFTTANRSVLWGNTTTLKDVSVLWGNTFPTADSVLWGNDTTSAASVLASGD